MTIKKKACVLLAWPLSKDSRAQKTAFSLLKSYNVDIYAVNDDFRGLSDLVKECRVFSVDYAYMGGRDHFLSPFADLGEALFDRVSGNGDFYDLVYAHDLDTLIAGVKLKKYFGCKLIYDVHDLSVETVNQGFPNVKGLKGVYYKLLIALLKSQYAKLEKRFIKNVDLVFTVNESLRNYLGRCYPGTPVKVINNFPVYLGKPQEKVLRKVAGLEDHHFVVIYHGNLGRGRYLPEIVESARFVYPEVRYVIIGDGELVKELKKDAPENVTFIDFVNYMELFSYTSDANLGLVLIEHINFSKKHASANKLFEYMACGIPVLVSNSPEMRKVVDHSDCGFVLEQITPLSISQKINALCADKGGLEVFGKRGRRMFEEKYNWDIEEKNMLHFIVSEL